MNAIRMRPGLCPDVELAVALELTSLELARAKSPAQLDRALSLNLRLWRNVRRLAGRHPDIITREALADTAEHMITMLVAETGPCPDPRDLSFVAGRGISLAQELAGSGAAERALPELVARWGGRGADHRAFLTWLIDRIAGE